MTDELREALAAVVTKWSGHLSERMLDDLVRAALAARPDSPTLDVERLAAALHKVYCTQNRPMHSHPWHSADAIAREYAALAPSSEDER